MSQTDLTKLDFDQIKDSIKEFLKSQDEFTDYDFEGSGLNVLMDVLAYNTHYNALLAHMTLNESDLATAQVRSNVVSRAQSLGYIPKSKKSSSAIIDITVTGAADSPNRITLKRGYKVSGKINNKTYYFVVLSDATAVKLSNNTYKFTNIPVYQGALKTETYRVDGLSPFQRFEISSEAVDTETLSVSITETDNQLAGESYAYYEKINDTKSTSKVFFFNENNFGRYELYFGDNFLGRRPTSGSKVTVEYLVTDGPESNGITTFASAGSIEGLPSISVSLAEGHLRSNGGTDKETVDSIRFNAPINYATQDRAVTADDYRSLLIRQFTDIQDISVWGGEDNDPPIYGKVFVAVALKDQERVTETFINSVKLFLKDKNVGAITPDIVEAEYTNIALEVDFKYDSNKSKLTAGQIESKVSDTVVKYNNDTLQTFNGVFRMSNLLKLIDESDPGIINSVVRTKMYKRFRPFPLKAEDYTITFPNALYISTTNESTINSSVFLLDGIECRFQDEPIGASTTRRIFVINHATSEKITKYSDVGLINPTKGTVYIKNIKFDLSNFVTIFAKPDSFDISPKYKQLLNIPSATIDIGSELDTVSLLGSTGLSSYQTFTRH
jgi:hypothetical protein